MYNIRKSSCIRFMQMYIMIFDDINIKKNDNYVDKCDF